MVKYLHSQRANINAKSTHGWTAAFGAAKFSEPAMLELLSQLGANINEVGNSQLWTPLMIAAFQGDVDSVWKNAFSLCSTVRIEPYHHTHPHTNNNNRSQRC